MIINGFTITLPKRYRDRSTFHERKSQRVNEIEKALHIKDRQYYHLKNYLWAAHKAAHFHRLIETRMAQQDWNAAKHYQPVRAAYHREACEHRAKYDAVRKE